MRSLIIVTAVLVVLAPQGATAYSVLAHEAMIDEAWDAEIAPLLRRQFPNVSEEAIAASRAYAYGGSLIQDLGYYPGGSRFFSNLVHHVKSGEFVASLMREARDVNEYAFALGALGHYAADNLGHSTATNRVVPIVYPKMREKHGPVVLYAHSPSRHIRVEFAFDVAQAARGNFKSDIYQQWIGFQVAAPQLERAFRATYGLELTEIFGDIDQAIGTYRKATSQIIPDITRLAGEEVFEFTAAQFDEEFGTNYRKPSFLARFIVTLSKIIPKFGPFKPLAFEPLTPETEQMFLDSFAASRARYGELLGSIRGGQLDVPDTDLDTGNAPSPGANPAHDETEAKLQEELAKD